MKKETNEQNVKTTLNHDTVLSHSRNSIQNNSGISNRNVEKEVCFTHDNIIALRA